MPKKYTYDPQFPGLTITVTEDNLFQGVCGLCRKQGISPVFKTDKTKSRGVVVKSWCMHDRRVHKKTLYNKAESASPRVPITEISLSSRPSVKYPKSAGSLVGLTELPKEKGCRCEVTPGLLRQLASAIEEIDALKAAITKLSNSAVRQLADELRRGH